MTTLHWSLEYVAAAHEFDTTRKSGWIIESLRQRPIAGIKIEAPLALSASDLYGIHDPAYVEAVRTGEPRALAESQGFRWDPGLWTLASAHTGGMAAAAERAMRERRNCGSLSSGQHHAAHKSGAGFCTFNGIALAAYRALKAGARRVLIIDLDAHCAGGTHSLIVYDGRIRQLDVAVNTFDTYTPVPPNSCDLVASYRDYLPVIQRRLGEIDAQGTSFDLCIYYAGMDPYEKCRIGGLPGLNAAILELREAMVFEWCRKRALPVAFGIGGGYVNAGFGRAELVDLHRFTLEAAASE